MVSMSQPARRRLRITERTSAGRSPRPTIRPDLVTTLGRYSLAQRKTLSDRLYSASGRKRLYRRGTVSRL
jgi:hypothetical protein